MKLYFENNNYKLYNGNMLELNNVIADNSIDAVVTDPPYNISKENDNRDRSKLNSAIMRRDKPINYDFGDWDNMERTEFLDFTREWFSICANKLKQGGTIISFFNKEDISYFNWISKEYDIRTRTIYVWHKTNPVPSFRKVNYLSACEFAYIGSKNGKSWTFNFGMQKEMHNFFETPNASSYKVTEHPTEKPLDMFAHLIQVHSNKGDLVLDPFMGSGTTAKVAKELGRKYIGFEISKNYCNVAWKRINSAETGKLEDLVIPNIKEPKTIEEVEKIEDYKQYEKFGWDF